MGLRAYVHTKHDIQYGECHFSWRREEVYDWLIDHGVNVYGGECSNEWEIDKDSLRSLKPEEISDFSTEDGVLSGEDMDAFVSECLAAPTGDYAYVSWF